MTESAAIAICLLAFLVGMNWHRTLRLSRELSQACEGLRLMGKDLCAAGIHHYFLRGDKYRCDRCLELAPVEVPREAERRSKRPDGAQDPPTLRCTGFDDPPSLR